MSMLSSSKGTNFFPNYDDDVIFSFLFVNQSNISTVGDNEDLGAERNPEDTLKRWRSQNVQVAFLLMRCTTIARECMAPRNQGNKNGDAPRRIVPVETPANALVIYQDIYVDLLHLQEVLGCKKGKRNKRSGPEWLFDIDLLTKSMNYEPVTAGNQTNKNAGIKDTIDVVPTQQYILLPLLYDSPTQLKEMQFANDLLKRQMNNQHNRLLKSNKEGYANSTNRDSTISPSVSTTRQIFTNADDLPTDPLMPDLEDTADLLNIGIFSGAYDDEDEGAEADLNNLETTMNVSPITITRIHKDHPKDQIIRDINSATQTRRMTKFSEEHAMVSYIKKKRRTNHKDYQNCLFTYFLLQIKPKKVTRALTDPSWIEAMQDELLQFSLQKVWRLVDLPKGKHAIGTKWVYRNKKDERGIVVRNKARLVAQGYWYGIQYTI
ncbi:putative ribonuclease H-like domain-containing protein [Tanacetum coccineum]|uniref:Ribonuclease H-like domain-containing protein n=1 Tax=Tanacetum coccineum TaxID=301880 RepID=A0ABQ5GP06_9ASTR